MACPDCEMARDLERHARLVAQGIEEAREAERYDLTPEERKVLLQEEEVLADLLDRITEKQLLVRV